MSGTRTLPILWPTTWQDYELVDSGNGMRLERYGRYTIARPEPHALWSPRLDEARWRSADARFERFNDLPEGQGQWLKPRRMDEAWPLRYGALRVNARLTPFKHTGIFPEQAVNWEWCAGLIASRRAPRVLNLFGYTGIATLSAAAAGAHVTHVDASRPAMTWARENQALSALDHLPIRWLVDDALKFVKRDVRRNARYEGIILDPPAFGRGPKGEVWRFVEGIGELLALVTQLLSDEALFLLVNAYAISDSATVLGNLLDEAVAGRGGTVEAGELALRESGPDGRLLSTSLFARWSNET